MLVFRSSALPETAPPAPARRIQVGKTRQYTTPSAAAAVAQDGDVIEIDAGVYAGDTAVWRANRLTIRGVGGLAYLQANGHSAQGKAIWVVQGDDAVIEHVEFSGCRVPDRNGAGIRQEGKNLTVRDCCFHDNENGLLAGASAGSEIAVERSEFRDNGAGDGQSHNLYIGRVGRLTMRFCWSHRARLGHLVKSRAETNVLLCNRLTDGADGESSYLIDLPNGGASFLIGNILQHGPRAQNRTAISYAAEGASNPAQTIFLVSNTFVNERPQGGDFLRVRGTPAVRAMNNCLTGVDGALNAAWRADGNFLAAEPAFADAAHGDYRLTASSPARGRGVNPGKAGEQSLMPECQYHHPCGQEPRPKGEKLDAGAYQFAEH